MMSQGPYTIRRAARGDARAVAQMWDRMARQHRQYDPESYDWATDSTEVFREHFEQMVRKENIVLLVAADSQDQPVGYLVGLCTDAPEIFAVKRRGRINDLYVLPEQRGSGLGRRLMQAGLTGLKECGAEEVDLQVSRENTDAIRFYESLGFRSVSLRMYKRL